MFLMPPANIWRIFLSKIRSRLLVMFVAGCSDAVDYVGTPTRLSKLFTLPIFVSLSPVSSSYFIIQTKVVICHFVPCLLNATLNAIWYTSRPSSATIGSSLLWPCSFVYCDQANLIPLPPHLSSSRPDLSDLNVVFQSRALFQKGLCFVDFRG